MKTINPVILAGGAGTRLWPLSRKSFPKQFSTIIGTHTLFQESVLRLRSSNHISFAKPITVTNADFRFIVVEQLQKIGIDPGAIIIEPQSKNTAPAILAATLYLASKDQDAIFLVSPSDHLIPETTAFHDAILMGLKELQKGNIVTFGISPNRPETGYGYLSLSNKPKGKPVSVKKFIEKPNTKIANSLIKNGKCLWNSGIFMFRARDIIKAFEKNASNFITPVNNAIENGKSDLGFFRLDPRSWEECQNISIDYAIMEHLHNLVAIPYFYNWSDLGDWEQIWSNMSQDTSGVALSENAHAIDCHNSLLRSESECQEIVGLGLQNIIAISMQDAVLVADKARAQDVKRVVDLLKIKEKSQAEILPTDSRPWGCFESLVSKKTFQVKRISVNPGAALSLQSHRFRSEHWIVVQGNAKVTINKETKFMETGEYVFVPLGSIHRLENLGNEQLVIIEVQIGTYLGEDDIVRYKDMYDRE